MDIVEDEIKEVNDNSAGSPVFNSTIEKLKLDAGLVLQQIEVLKSFECEAKELVASIQCFLGGLGDNPEAIKILKKAIDKVFIESIFAVEQDWQERLKNERRSILQTSPQLTLGQLIKKIEGINPVYNIGSEEKEKQVVFDFCSAVPTELDSWRGSYCELALGYELDEFNKESHYVSVSGFLKELKGALNRFFCGWKGGEYLMDKNTPIWVDNPGYCHKTAIINVIEDDNKVWLITGKCYYLKD